MLTCIVDLLTLMMDILFNLEVQQNDISQIYQILQKMILNNLSFYVTQQLMIYKTYFQKYKIIMLTYKKYYQYQTTFYTSNAFQLQKKIQYQKERASQNNFYQITQFIRQKIKNFNLVFMFNMIDFQHWTVKKFQILKKLLVENTLKKQLSLIPTSLLTDQKNTIIVLTQIKQFCAGLIKNSTKKNQNSRHNFILKIII
eukprot:TRINITY_DN5214_c0_g1_i2.p2 TRINITY_DN5214_c0_g1~~TRINITY_DN5214_c0_g1_i2.p2  ORF type:complete len:199 (+),score=3.87 TRINITY_DN5214_c0_g1_i2:340-936(+)